MSEIQTGELGMEITRVLPPDDEKEVSTSRIKDFIGKVIERLLGSLRHVPPPIGTRRVFEIHRNGNMTTTGAGAMPSFLYREVIREKLADYSKSSEADELYAYLWERRAFKNTFSGPDPDRKDWESWAFQNLIVFPLTTALEATELEVLVDGSLNQSWNVDSDKLVQAIDDVIAVRFTKRWSVTAYCPVGGLPLEQGQSVDISPSIKLKGFTDRETCIFLSRYSDEFLWDDFKSPAIQKTIAQITLLNMSRNEDAMLQVSERLDDLKLALLLAFEQDKPIVEGTCVLVGSFSNRVGKFRRDENFPGAHYVFEKEKVERCSRILQLLASCGPMDRQNDLKGAIWHLGRACVASLPRDILLESAIGLDSVLVHGGGDSRYRFYLHGATILSKTTGESIKIAESLKDIYEKRGRAAHGKRSTKLDDLARLARKYLAETILSVMELALAGKINIAEGVAKGVEKYVFEKSTSEDKT